MGAVDPILPIQNRIAEEVKKRMTKAKELKTEANRILEQAKRKIEEINDYQTTCKPERQSTC